MIAARVGNDSSLSFGGSERGNLVVGTADLECPYGLQILKFQEQLSGVGLIRILKFNKWSAYGYPLQSRLCFANIIQSNYGFLLYFQYHRHDQRPFLHLLRDVTL
jgi:hypothetical protein